MSEVISKTTKVRKGIGLKIVLGIIGGLAGGVAISFVISNPEWLLYQCKKLVGKVPTEEELEEEVTELEEEEGEGEESEKNSKLRTLIASLVKEQLEQSLEGYQRDLEESRRQLDDAIQEEEEESNEEEREVFPASPVLPHTPTSPPTTATFSVSGLAAKVNSLQEIVDGHQREIEYLKELISSSGTTPQVKKTVERFDLQNHGFQYMFDSNRNKFLVNKEKVKIDEVSLAVTGEMLDKLFPFQKEKFKAELKKYPVLNAGGGCVDYDFGVRTTNDDYNAAQWLNVKIVGEDKNGKKAKSGGWDNKFEVDNPVEKEIMLGTGTGKSTFFFRCMAHGGSANDYRGATLVVPFPSLVDSVLDAHNNWLSKGKDVMKDGEGNWVEDPKKRVTVCIFCGQNHSAKFDENGNPIYIDEEQTKQAGKYELAHNKPGEFINIFTFHEFLDALVNEKRDSNGNLWIKEWVIFDEAHTDSPACFRTIIDILGTGQKRIKGNTNIVKAREELFKIVQMSATFGHIPTCRKLAGNPTDLFVVKFTDVPNYVNNKKVFAGKIIAFYDKLDNQSWESVLPSLKEVKERGVKVVFLDRSLKDIATRLVRALKPPVLIIASREYSVGFSFGDVSVITTGRAKREIVVEENKQLISKDITGVSSFNDELQERGRTNREETFAGYWFCQVPPGKEESFNLGDKDHLASRLKEEFMRLNIKQKKWEISKGLKEITKDIVRYYNTPRAVAEIKEKEGKEYLHLILIDDLKQKLHPRNMFIVLPSEKGIKEPGEYVFKSKELMKFFEKDILTDLLIAATDELILPYATKYGWYKTATTKDDHVYNTRAEAEIVGFYYQAREKVNGYDWVDWIRVRNKAGNEEKIGFKLKFKPFEMKEEVRIEVPVN